MALTPAGQLLVVENATRPSIFQISPTGESTCLFAATVHGCTIDCMRHARWQSLCSHQPTRGRHQIPIKLGLTPTDFKTILQGSDLAGGAAAISRFDALCSDVVGNLYLAYHDFGLPYYGPRFIRKIPRAGASDVIVNIDSMGFDNRSASPMSHLMFDHAGNFIVLDTGNHQILCISPDGNVGTGRRGHRSRGAR